MWSYDTVLFACLCLCFGSAISSLTWRWQQVANYAWRQEAHQLLGLPCPDPKPLSVWHARSICPHCKHTLTVSALVPLLSYLRTKGRCQFCHHPIAKRYPVIELLTFSALFPLWWLKNDAYELSLQVALITTLITAAIIDAEAQWLPDSCHLSVLVCATLLLDYQHSDVFEHLYSGLFGFGFLIVLRAAFLRIRRIEAVGLGDAKLLGVLLFWLGFGAAQPVLLVASLSGLIFALLSRTTYSKPIAFGPFLIGASVLYFFMSSTS